MSQASPNTTLQASILAAVDELLMGAFICALWALLLLLPSKKTLLDIAESIDSMAFVLTGRKLGVVLLRACGWLCALVAAVLFVLYWVVD